MRSPMLERINGEIEQERFRLLAQVAGLILTVVGVVLIGQNIAFVGQLYVIWQSVTVGLILVALGIGILARHRWL